MEAEEAMKEQEWQEKIAPIVYDPTEDDLRRVQMIRDFLEEEGIPYEEDTDIFGVFYVNDRTTQLRYVDSFFHRMDNEKRFGESCKGIDHDYFVNISHDNYDKGVRTIWIFDFEMDQVNKTYEFEGETIEGYHRQWEVIKNTIRTACGKIRHRFYARDCEVKVVPAKELRGFLNTFCFYGYRSASVNLGLYLKKEKNGFPKGTLMFVYTFGSNFYGNKLHEDDPNIEVIRASTRIGCQVIGGISKSIKYFCMNYPILFFDERPIDVNRIIFYVDASHNDSRGMVNSNSSFKFVSWDGCGFINMFTDDYDCDGLVGTKGETFMRRPLFHKPIMKAIALGKIVSIANAGTIVFDMYAKDFIAGLEPKEQEYVEQRRLDIVREYNEARQLEVDKKIARYMSARRNMAKRLRNAYLKPMRKRLKEASRYAREKLIASKRR